MEDKIYYDKTKGLMYLGGALLSFLGMFVIRGGLIGVFLLVAGLALIYWGFKSMSGKPQLVFSEKGLWVDLSDKKQIPWSAIQKVKFGKAKVDGVMVEHIFIHVKLNTNNKHNMLVKKYPIANLKTNRFELMEIFGRYKPELANHSNSEI